MVSKYGVRSKTKKGHMVRSKSERWIADLLLRYGIEYKYEVSIKLDGKLFKPDFYLPNFDVYIEYFGMMKKKDYRERTRWKKKMYNKHKLKVIYLYPHDIFTYPQKNFIRLITKRIRYLIDEARS